MLVIFIFHFSTDEHFKLIEGLRLILPCENYLLFYVLHNFKRAILNFGCVNRHIIEKSVMQMSNM